MKHTKHKAHPYDKVAAIPEFNKDHWVKEMGDVNVADLKYGGGNFGQEEDYKKSVDKLSSYVKSHKAQH